MKKVAIGVVVIVFYALAALMTHVPVRPLFDGAGPPLPYSWVLPPPGFSNNKKPRPFSQDVEFGNKGSVGANVATNDGQAVMILPEGSFAKHGADKSVRIRFVPLDPKKIDPQPNPPAQGNAYAITARFEPSKTTAEPAHNVTVLLRYPAHAAALLRLDGKRWTQLSGQQNLPTTLQIYANTKKLGTFTAAGGRDNRVILWYITAFVSFVAGSLGLILGLRERRRPPPRRRN